MMGIATWYDLYWYLHQSPDKVKLGIAVSLSNSEYDDKKVQIGDALVKLAQAIKNRMGFGNM